MCLPPAQNKRLRELLLVETLEQERTPLKLGRSMKRAGIL